MLFSKHNSNTNMNTNNSSENTESQTFYNLSSVDTGNRQKNLPSYLVSSQHYESFDSKLTYICNMINTHTNKIQESTNTSISIMSMVSDSHYNDAATEIMYSLLAREGSYLSPLKKNEIVNTNTTKHDDNMHFLQQSALCSVILNKLSKFLSLKLDEQIALTGMYVCMYI